MLNPNEIKLNRVLHGKNQEVLKGFPDSFFDSIITDPPYELNFCGKSWDNTGVAYSVAMWREVLRVAKPGATLFCFGGTRTYHRVACAIEDAGWQLKDSLIWLYGSGFPKSLDICKQIDKEAGRAGERGYIETTGGLHGGTGTTVGCFTGRQLSPKPVSELAKKWNGYGTALKPSFEPIILAMKPLEKGLTYAQNARKWGVAGLNIDAGRISSPENIGKVWTRGGNQQGSSLTTNTSGEHQYITANSKGRWPANVILSHSPDCVQVGTHKIRGHTGYPDGPKGKSHHYSSQARSKDVRPNAWPGHADENGQETIDVYACVPNCPIRIMDTQSGQSKSTILKHQPREAVRHGSSLQLNQEGSKWIDGMGGGHSDSGGASRFFYTAKASRSERESGLKDFVPCAQCGEFGTEQHKAKTTTDPDTGEQTNRPAGNCIRNSHPTVKPIAIMKYLCELIRMPERIGADGKPDPSKAQVILDPFCGSGSTLLAADEVGLKYIGIDMGLDNVAIASFRSVDTPPDDAEPATLQDPATLAQDVQNLSHDDFQDLII